MATGAALRQRLGQAARRGIVEQFGFRRRMERIRSIYDQLLATPSPWK